MKSNNDIMVTKTGSALKEEEEEDMELELGLSIGGRYNNRRPEKLVCVRNKRSDSKFEDNREKVKTCTRSSVSTSFIMGDPHQQGILLLDPKMKREIHALRRQEAKKKREEKQQVKKVGFFKRRIGERNGLWLKTGDFQDDDDDVNNNNNNNKHRDFDNAEDRKCKKSKTENTGSDYNNNVKNVNLNLNIEQNNTNHHHYQVGTSMLPVLPGQCPYPKPYGPASNGFFMPCWLTGGDKVGKERNAVEAQVFSYGFGLFRAGSDPGHGLANGYDSEPNSGREEGNLKAGSNWSSVCTTSAGSHHRSSSLEGGGSSDTRSHSSHCVSEQFQLNSSKANSANRHSECSATSQLFESALGNEATIHVEKMISPNGAQSSPIAPKEEANSEREPDPTNKHISAADNSTSHALKESNRDIGKPPKPQTQDLRTPAFPYMPCVSTTGNGPNGKTINGFLYKYTKAEVSIVCVCHGNSFTPAEFVQHAGGTDVTHPLRHITVISSAF